MRGRPIIRQQHEDKCSLCNIPSTLRPVERLPNNAIEIIATHPDGTTHKWVEYPSFEAVGKQDTRNKIDPRIINCPICHKRGRINGFNNFKSGHFNYVVVHERIEGTWGKLHHARRRRCYITTPEQRRIVLRRLGRLLEKTPTKTIREAM